MHVTLTWSVEYNREFKEHGREDREGIYSSTESLISLKFESQIERNTPVNLKCMNKLNPLTNEFIFFAHKVLQTCLFSSLSILLPSFPDCV